MKGFLVFEDGTVLEGKAFGSRNTVAADICFHTEMAGYENILTDPANSGLIVMMTYPLIGNYGFSAEDYTKKAYPAGLIVKDFSEHPSHYQCEYTISQFLRKNNIFGLSYVDTRLTARKLLNSQGLKCCLTVEEPSVSLFEKVYKSVVTADGSVEKKEIIENKENSKKVAIIDLGSKAGLVNRLKDKASLYIYPNKISADDILSEKPTCVYITHGGGKIEGIEHISPIISAIIDKTEINAEGFGALALAKALGMEVIKMPNGYRGANFPVINLTDGKVKTTSFNIGYTIAENKLPEGLEVTERNLNDNSIAAFRYKNANASLYTI